MLVNDWEFSIDTNSGRFSSTAGYEAGNVFDTKGSRASLLGEDDVMRQSNRDLTESKSLTLQRNSSTGAWCVRKHTDFVATHNLDCESDHPGLDEDVEGIIAEWSMKKNFDIRERHGLQDHIRIDESSRTFSGCLLYTSDAADE